MSDFVFGLLLLLGILQPFALGWCLFVLLVKAVKSAKTLTKPNATYNIRAENVQINGER